MIRRLLFTLTLAVVPALLGVDRPLGAAPDADACMADARTRAAKAVAHGAARYDARRQLEIDVVLCQNPALGKRDRDVHRHDQRRPGRFRAAVHARADGRARVPQRAPRSIAKAARARRRHEAPRRPRRRRPGRRPDPRRSGPLPRDTAWNTDRRRRMSGARHAHDAQRQHTRAAPSAQAA